MIDQKQSGGKGSLNIQAENLAINTGLTYKDVVDISTDIFRKNFYELSETAQTVAIQRATELVEGFVNALEKRNPNGIRVAQDPDFQCALFEAQKDYARVGDSDLASILIDILVDRTKEEARSFQSIVLNASLAVAPKLTSDQITALSLIFAFRYTQHLMIRNLPLFFEIFKSQIVPFSVDLPKRDSSYLHLEFIGCCKNSHLSSITFEKMILSTYAGLFSLGFDKDSLQKIIDYSQLPDSFITLCIHDPKKIQLNVMNKTVFNSMVEKLNLKESDVKALYKLHEKSLMNEKQVREYILSQEPALLSFINSWNESSIKEIELTSVGIAIGHANYRRVTGETADLSIWI